jgi:hypothetical protein
MDPQQAPMNPRLSSVLPNRPASDWAKSTEAALSLPASGMTENTMPGQKNCFVQQGNTPARPQEHTESSIGAASAVRYVRDQQISNLTVPEPCSASSLSTPGVQVPGAWTDKPSSTHQVLNDASEALASVGSAAYNALPKSIKGAFSNQSM